MNLLSGLAPIIEAHAEAPQLLAGARISSMAWLSLFGQSINTSTTSVHPPAYRPTPFHLPIANNLIKERI
jgi:hypothetical protein